MSVYQSTTDVVSSPPLSRRKKRGVPRFTAGLGMLLLLTTTVFAQKEKVAEVKAPPPDTSSTEWSKMQIGRALAKPIPDPKVSPEQQKANTLRYLGTTPPATFTSFNPQTGATLQLTPSEEQLAATAQKKAVDGQPGVAPKGSSGPASVPAKKSPEGTSSNSPGTGTGQSSAGAQTLAATPPSAFTTPYSFPYNTEYRLLLRFNTGGVDYYYLCSASQSGSFELLSAGHCVYNHDIKNDGSDIAGFAAEIWAWPAETDVVDPIDHDNWPDYPYGVAKATYWLAYNNWIDSSDLNWDFSFITLDRRTGDHLGWMGREWGVTTSALNFDGYPAQAPYVPADNPFQYPGYDANNVTSYTDNRINMAAYVYGGHSGGGVWRFDGTNRYIEGVNSTSDRVGDAQATRFTSTNETTLDNAITDDNTNRPPAALPQVIEYVFNNSSKGLLDTSVSIGDTFGLQMNAFNAGYASAGDVSADIYLDQSSVGVTAGTYIGTVDLGTLDANTYTIQNQTVTIPRTVPPGFWYVGYHLRSANAQYGTDNPDVIITKQTLQTYCTNDAYESDNSFGTASTLAVGGTQLHSICAQADVDYVKFTLTVPSAITLQTYGGTSGGDTTLTLYNSSFAQIAFNDDSNGTFYSSISTTCSNSLPAGTYYAAVQSYNNATVIPAYYLSLGSSSCAPALSSVSLSPTFVYGGASSTGTVTLTHPALTGGYVVTLASSSGAVHVPASVTVAAGATTGTFTITTSTVNSDLSATITASHSGSTSATTTLNVVPTPKLSGFTIAPNSVIGGANSIGTVTLTGAAGGTGFVVHVSDTSPTTTMPGSVTVPAGATTATFTINTAAVTVIKNIPVTATDGTVTKSANLQVVPQPSLTNFTVAPDSVIGGNSSIGTVSINTLAPTGGFVVHVSDASPSTTMPGSVTIPEGASSATFTITTSAVTVIKNIPVTATDGTVSKSANLQLVPQPALTNFTIAPASVIGGANSTGTVTISTLAPTGGFVVHVSDSSPSTTMPATVTVPEGSNTGTFTITTSAVTVIKNIPVTATDGTVSKSANLQLVPKPALTSFSIAPTSVLGGTNVTGTVGISTLAPTGGFVIHVSDASPSTTMPATVTVPAGSNTGTFTINTLVVTVDKTIPITATDGTVSKTVNLILTH